MHRNVFRITITAFAAAILIATIGVLACSPTTTPTPTPDYYYIKGTRYVSGPHQRWTHPSANCPRGFTASSPKWIRCSHFPDHLLKSSSQTSPSITASSFITTQSKR